MAKQGGPYKIKGKMNGRSYYSVKNGIGWVSRSINPAMSERVKTAVEYANTRSHNAEFAIKAKFASRWRNLGSGVRGITLPQFQRQDIIKLVTSYMNRDSAPIGKRGFDKQSLTPELCEIIMASAKRRYMGDLGSIELTYQGSAPDEVEFVTARYNYIGGSASDYIAKGFKTMRVTFAKFMISTIKYYDYLQGYVPISSAFTYVNQGSYNINLANDAEETIVFASSPSTRVVDFGESGWFGFVVVLFQPYLPDGRGGTYTQSENSIYIGNPFDHDAW